jgi:hypothetical protein
MAGTVALRPVCGIMGDMELNSAELGLVNNALNEVLNGPLAIPGWEFHTRMGGSREEAEVLLRRIRESVR